MAERRRRSGHLARAAGAGRERLAATETLDDEHRERVLAAIDREIARLRAQ